MNRIYERAQSMVALTPKMQTAGGTDTGQYIDGAGLADIDFMVMYGTLAAGNKLTVAVMCAEDDQGTNAEQIGMLEVVAPTGGLQSGVAVASLEVDGDRPRYYAVKISNTSSAEVPVSAVALGSTIYSAEHAQLLVIN